MPGFAPPQHQQDGQHVQHVQAGLWWPAADSAKLRAAAHAWRDMAKAIDSAHAASHSAALSVFAENQGTAVDSFAAYWQKWTGSDGYLPACSQACIAMGDALDRYANAVDDARRRVEELVAEIATAVVIGVVLTVFTVGISDAAAGAVSAALIANAALVGVELSATAAGIAATILVGVTVGAVEAMAIDAAAIQPERILIFHDQKDFSWEEMLQWGEMGAAGGLVLGGLGVGVRVLRGAFPKDVPTVFFDSTKAGIKGTFDQAVVDGAPTTLTRTTTRAAIRANRRDALRGQTAPPAGQSLDEYPFASSEEGGAGSTVKAVPESEQDYQGGTLSRFYQDNNIGHGDRYRVAWK